MIQEHKDLLITDLCGRLPYRVKVHAKYIDTDIEVEKDGVLSMVDNDTIIAFTCDDTNCYNYVAIHEVKPYLFPMSSMTEEQKQEYTYIVNYISSDDTENWKEGEFIYVEQFTQLMRFYHMNHLDYMGLIPMGLAIDASLLNIY